VGLAINLTGFNVTDIFYQRGIIISSLNLWLDARRVQELGFISHAHSDHVGRHKRIFASPPTAKILNSQQKRPLTIHQTSNLNQETPGIYNLPYFQPHALNGASLTLYPAGHILGSAQILIEEKGRRILYSGDFSLEENPAAEKAQVPACDTLIMECTYGDPQYRFPPRRQIARQLVELVTKTLGQDYTPIVFAYTLGKAQEAIKILGDAGIPTATTPTIFALCEIYRECGLELKNYEEYRKERLPGKVLVLPPHSRRYDWYRSIRRTRTFFLSGWAQQAGAERMFGVDMALPLSDHADYQQLFDYIELAKPRRIYTLHGPAAFAQELKRRGFRASHLEETASGPKQLEMFKE
jgi:Cft2 family RNA processing exonuclease